MSDADSGQEVEIAVAEELIELGRKKCSSGQILRKGFTTKKGVKVPPACVTDTGAKGKTPKNKRWFPEGVDIGRWKKTKSDGARRIILADLLDDGRTCGSVLRDVNALANVTADKETKRKLRADYKWLRKQDVCTLKSKK
jgi:hypothetical protein